MTTKITFNKMGQEVKRETKKDNDMSHALLITIEEYCKFEGVELKSGLRDAITDILHIAKKTTLNMKTL